MSNAIWAGVSFASDPSSLRAPLLNEAILIGLSSEPRGEKMPPKAVKCMIHDRTEIASACDESEV